MYYMALVAPEDINAEALKWKQYFQLKYGSSAALRSPAHITLIPPFWMTANMENTLMDAIRLFCEKQKRFQIRLNGFGAFSPRVIYIAVEKNNLLNMVQSSLKNYLLEQRVFPVKNSIQEFHPHITLASRDLRKQSFFDAWKMMEHKKYEAQWEASGISLLRLNPEKWEVIYTGQFAL